MRVLVVEDQSLIGKAIVKGLEEEGFAVDWVTNLGEGMHRAAEHDYDSVILDLILPDGSGSRTRTRPCSSCPRATRLRTRRSRSRTEQTTTSPSPSSSRSCSCG